MSGFQLPNIRPPGLMAPASFGAPQSTEFGFNQNGSYGQLLPAEYSVMSGYGAPAMGLNTMGGAQGLTAPGGFGTPNTTGLGASAGSFPAWMPEWMQSAVGTKEQPGWGGLAMSAAGGVASLAMGLKQYGLAKDTLKENKRQFQMNYDAQKQTTNTALEDRQRARVASNAGAYQSVGDYMNTNGVK